MNKYYRENIEKLRKEYSITKTILIEEFEIKTSEKDFKECALDFVKRYMPYKFKILHLSLSNFIGFCLMKRSENEYLILYFYETFIANHNNSNVDAFVFSKGYTDRFSPKTSQL